MEQSKLKKSHIYIGLIILLAVFIVRGGIGLHNVQYAGDATSYFFSNQIIIKDSFLSGVMPLWNPFIMSGTPMLAKAQLPVISIYSLISLVIGSPYLAMTLNALVHLVILGVGVYFLSRTVGLEERYSFLAAIVVMLSSYVSASLFFAFFQFMGIAFFPYVVMFTIKGLKEKIVRNAILGGVFVALEFLSGSFEVFTFTWWIVLFILVYNLFGKRFDVRILKSVTYGVVFFIVGVGLVAVKLFPAYELANISQRQEPYDFERAVGSHVNLGNAYTMIVDDRDLPNFIEHAVKGTGSISLGIITSLLILASFMNIRKKRYLFFFLMGIFALLMATKSPWNFFLYNFFPFFNKQKHVLKSLFVFLFIGAVLSAFGARYVIARVGKKYAKAVYVGIVVLVVLTSWGFSYEIQLKDSRAELEGVKVMEFMSRDSEMFRFKAWETNGIDWGTNYYSVQYGLHDVYGSENLWLLEYLPLYLSVGNSNPSKLFGILNMKYFTSQNAVNISGFEFVEKFDDTLSGCEYSEGRIIDFDEMKECPAYEVLEKAWGPYLYENTEFLPRAYLVRNSILVVGPQVDNIGGQRGGNGLEDGMDNIYMLMRESNFNPSNTVVIRGKEIINDYKAGELSKYSAIFLTPGSVDENSGFLLNEFVSNGGRLLPNIVAGKTSVDFEDVQGMWDSFNGSLEEVSYTAVNVNKYSAKVEGAGWLVVSEKFSMFPGWRVNVGEIERADGVISAVYVENSGEVVFEYKPDSYIMGRNITVVILILVIGFFVFFRRKNEA